MEAYEVSAGDLLLFSGRGWVSWGIRVGSCSPYSHGGIVAAVTAGDFLPKKGRRWWMPELQRQRWGPRLLLFESTTLVNRPCEITRRRIEGVQAQEIQWRVDTYPGRVWRMGLTTPLYFSESTRLTERLLDYLGTPYDPGGALLAGTLLLKRGILAPRAADRSALYCIETIEAVLRHGLAGRDLPAFRPGQTTPAGMVRRLLKSGLYSRPERIK